MRYLGLDLGTKTLGISITDSTNTIASIYKTIRHDENYRFLIEELKLIVKEKAITDIVLGFPKNMDNTLGKRAEVTMSFKNLLEKELLVKVILEDERLTSVMANNLLIDNHIRRDKRKKQVDNLAAVLILESYLNRKGEK